MDTDTLTGGGGGGGGGVGSQASMNTDTLTGGEEARHLWMIQGCSEYPGNPRIL